ncbi:hypothetical protein BDK51DRAFT_32512, partial [Blyttiomyces helicus]
ATEEAKVTKVAKGEPKETTVSPTVTEEAPKVTEEAPKVTEEPPKVTEEPPKVTEEAPKVTTVLLQVTTDVPQVTTVSPQVTTEVPQVTTEVPQVTTESSQVTTEPPEVKTVDAEGTTKRDSIAAEPEPAKIAAAPDPPIPEFIPSTPQTPAVALANDFVPDAPPTNPALEAELELHTLASTLPYAFPPEVVEAGIPRADLLDCLEKLINPVDQLSARTTARLKLVDLIGAGIVRPLDEREQSFEFPPLDMKPEYPDEEVLPPSSRPRPRPMPSPKPPSPQLPQPPKQQHQPPKQPPPTQQPSKQQPAKQQEPKQSPRPRSPRSAAAASRSPPPAATPPVNPLATPELVDLAKNLRKLFSPSVIADGVHRAPVVSRIYQLLPQPPGKRILRTDAEKKLAELMKAGLVAQIGPSQLFDLSPKAVEPTPKSASMTPAAESAPAQTPKPQEQDLVALVTSLRKAFPPAAIASGIHRSAITSRIHQLLPRPTGAQPSRTVADETLAALLKAGLVREAEAPNMIDLDPLVEVKPIPQPVGNSLELLVAHLRKTFPPGETPTHAQVALRIFQLLPKPQGYLKVRSAAEHALQDLLRGGLVTEDAAGKIDLEPPSRAPDSEPKIVEYPASPTSGAEAAFAALAALAGNLRTAFPPAQIMEGVHRNDALARLYHLIPHPPGGRLPPAAADHVLDELIDDGLVKQIEFSPLLNLDPHGFVMVETKEEEEEEEAVEAAVVVEEEVPTAKAADAETKSGKQKRLSWKELKKRPKVEKDVVAPARKVTDDGPLVGGGGSNAQGRAGTGGWAWLDDAASAGVEAEPAPPRAPETDAASSDITPSTSASAPQPDAPPTDPLSAPAPPGPLPIDPAHARAIDQALSTFPIGAYVNAAKIIEIALLNLPPGNSSAKEVLTRTLCERVGVPVDDPEMLFCVLDKGGLKFSKVTASELMFVGEEGVVRDDAAEGGLSAGVESGLVLDGAGDASEGPRKEEGASADQSTETTAAPSADVEPSIEAKVAMDPDAHGTPQPAACSTFPLPAPPPPLPVDPARAIDQALSTFPLGSYVNAPKIIETALRKLRTPDHSRSSVTEILTRTLQERVGVPVEDAEVLFRVLDDGGLKVSRVSATMMAGFPKVFIAY